MASIARVALRSTPLANPPAPVFITLLVSCTCSLMTWLGAAISSSSYRPILRICRMGGSSASRFDDLVRCWMR